jgi:hypothetical protein
MANAEIFLLNMNLVSGIRPGIVEDSARREPRASIFCGVQEPLRGNCHSCRRITSLTEITGGATISAGGSVSGKLNASQKAPIAIEKIRSYLTKSPIIRSREVSFAQTAIANCQKKQKYPM